MSKVTKKQLEHRIDLLSAENDSQHNYMMRIKRALRSINIDVLSDEFDKKELTLIEINLDMPESYCHKCGRSDLDE